MTTPGSSGSVLVPAAYATGVWPQPAADMSSLTGGEPNARGLYLDVVVDATAVGGAGTVTVTIDGKDPASGKYYNLLTSAVLAANATTVLRLGPGLTPAANLTVNAALPETFRITATVAGNAVTFSLGYQIR